MHSVALANLHFWLGTVGILLYVGAMWTSGITQGVMLNATTENGTVLAYPNFLDTLNTIRPMMLMRVIGGSLYLVGWFLLIYNLWKTIATARPVNGTIEVFADEGVIAHEDKITLVGTFLNPPVAFSILGVGFSCAWMFGGDILSIAGMFGLLLCVVLAYATSNHAVKNGPRGMIASSLTPRLLRFSSSSRSRSVDWCKSSRPCW